MDADFTQLKTARVYKMMSDFKEAYYGVMAHESSNQITPIDFIERYPIFVIDVRRQPEQLKKSTVKTITLKAKFSANVPANTMVYTVLISDRILWLESDGTNFHKIY